MPPRLSSKSGCKCCSAALLEERRRAEEYRRREELTRIQAEEEKGQAALELEADLWTTSRNILTFLEACEEMIRERVGPVDPESLQKENGCYGLVPTRTD